MQDDSDGKESKKGHKRKREHRDKERKKKKDKKEKKEKKDKDPDKEKAKVCCVHRQPEFEISLNAFATWVNVAHANCIWLQFVTVLAAELVAGECITWLVVPHAPVQPVQFVPTRVSETRAVWSCLSMINMLGYD